MYLAELHAIYTSTDITAWFLLQRILNIFLSNFGTWHSRTEIICIRGAVVAQWIRPQTLNGEVPSSNLLAAESSALVQGILSSLPSPLERI